MTDHRPVTTILAGDHDTVTVHFHCPCGTNRAELVVANNAHPLTRYTTALRNLHQRGQWPPAPSNLGDATASGWPLAPGHDDELAAR